LLVFLPARFSVLPDMTGLYPCIKESGQEVTTNNARCRRRSVPRRV
jgi:hypothetical protein